MQLKTKHFGLIEVNEKEIIQFSDGLPGFNQVKKFILLGNEDESSPFSWLQSVDSPELAFVVCDPFRIKEDYDIDIKDEVVESLEIETISDVKVLSIVVVPEDMSKISMNLKAPVVINTARMKGMQIFLDTDKYGVRHYIMEELRKQEVAVNAGADKKEGSDYCNK
jgi:flagellar assembly factor FliW